MLKSFAFLAVLTVAGTAAAQAPTCNSPAEQKNWSGAQAMDKKLSGAAKNSFVTKCVKGALS